MVCKDSYEARWPMVSALNSGSRGLVSSPGWEHGVFYAFLPSPGLGIHKL